MDNNNCMNNRANSRMNTIPYRNPNYRTMTTYSNMGMNTISDNYVPGMAYVPWQSFENVYDACKGLSRGTIFADLDKPFKGGCHS